MNNVCLAGQVAVMFRRLVHVVSTVSVVQQYHIYKRSPSTAEHTLSQPTVEYQDLSLGQPLFNPERPPTIHHVLTEQWNRLRGGNFWESCRSTLSAQQPQQLQWPNFSAYPSRSQLSLLIPPQVLLHFCHGSGQRDRIRLILMRSPHPIKLHLRTPT